MLPTSALTESEASGTRGWQLSSIKVYQLRKQKIFTYLSDKYMLSRISSYGGLLASFFFSFCSFSLGVSTELACELSSRSLKSILVPAEGVLSLRVSASLQRRHLDLTFSGRFGEVWSLLGEKSEGLKSFGSVGVKNSDWLDLPPTPP